MTATKIRRVAYVRLCEILSEEDLEIIELAIGHDFTWGDTDVVLVSQEALLDSIGRRFTWARRDVHEMEAAQRVRYALEQLRRPEVMVRID